MSIEFQCNQCQSILRVPSKHAGKQAKCPQCEFINMIPMSSTAPTAAPGSPGSSDQPPGHTTNPYSDPVSPPPAGNPYQSTTASAAQKQFEADRGGLILTLGIFSLVACNCCYIPGILAWAFGATDLKKMAAGTMDPSGESLTRVGMILGIVATVLYGLGGLFYFVMVVLGVAMEQNF